jgi:hypothetical protein
VADGRGVTALDLMSPAAGYAREPIGLATQTVGPPVAPAAAIPMQIGPAVTVSLLHGCEQPLEALKSAPRSVACHPCDEAVVRLLVARVRHPIELLICPKVAPGTLRFD